MTGCRAAGPALCCALMFAAGLAHADGMPRGGYYEPRYSWTGFYVGGDVGYAWGMSSGVGTNFAGIPGSGPVYSFDPSGVIGGAYLGYNHQIDHLVVGIEADWQAADLRGNSGPIIVSFGGTNSYTVSSEVKDYGSVRGRLGYAMDRLLIFGTGGYAWGSWKTDYSFTGVSPPFDTNKVNNNTGWTVGGGLEYAITNNWLARVEYRHTDLGSASSSSAAANTASTDKLTIDDVRVGISYKFGQPYEPLR